MTVKIQHRVFCKELMLVFFMDLYIFILQNSRCWIPGSLEEVNSLVPGLSKSFLQSVVSEAAGVLNVNQEIDIWCSFE